LSVKERSQNLKETHGKTSINEGKSYGGKVEVSSVKSMIQMWGKTHEGMKYHNTGNTTSKNLYVTSKSTLEKHNKVLD